MFDIIIPTCNRAPILSRCLSAVFQMKGVAAARVFVVDDGSSDETGSVLAEWAKQHPNLEILHQKNAGPGAARNAALARTNRPYLLFLDDDVFPDENLMAAHREFLEQGFDLSQGYLDWHPEIADHPVLRFLDRQGWQFTFHHYAHGAEISYLHIYTANLAVRRERMEGLSFDTHFNKQRYAFEDTTFGYHLARAGARIGLNRRAHALHFHPVSETEIVERNYKVGYSCGILGKYYPEILKEMKMENIFSSHRLQLVVLQLVKLFPCLRALAGEAIFLRLRCREAFCKGIREYLRDQQKRTN